MVYLRNRTVLPDDLTQLHLCFLLSLSPLIRSVKSIRIRRSDVLAASCELVNQIDNSDR